MRKIVKKVVAAVGEPYNDSRTLRYCAGEGYPENGGFVFVKEIVIEELD